MDKKYGWKKSVAAGILAGLSSILLVILYLQISGIGVNFPEPSLSMSFLSSFYVSMLGIGGLLTVGLPVTLYLKYGLKSPLVLMVIIFIFWFVAGNFGSQGDSPWQAFLFVFFPVYTALYLIGSGIEYYVVSNKLME